MGNQDIKIIETDEFILDVDNDKTFIVVHKASGARTERFTHPDRYLCYECYLDAFYEGTEFFDNLCKLEVGIK